MELDNALYILALLCYYFCLPVSHTTNILKKTVCPCLIMMTNFLFSTAFGNSYKHIWEQTFLIIFVCVHAHYWIYKAAKKLSRIHSINGVDTICQLDGRSKKHYRHPQKCKCKYGEWF